SDLLRVITSGRWPVTAPRREGPRSAQASIPPSTRRGESRKWSWSKSVRHRCFPGEGGAKDADHRRRQSKGWRRQNDQHLVRLRRTSFRVGDTAESAKFQATIGRDLSRPSI